MRKPHGIGRMLLLSSALAAVQVANAADVIAQRQDLGTTRVLVGAAPEGSGGGELALPTDFMDDDWREEIQARIKESIDRLRSQGRLMASPGSGLAAPLLLWPLRIAPGLSDPGVHGISNFIDEDARFPNFLLDYNCGGRTYDTASGYNHAGTDIFTWPWYWKKMDFSEVQIVAAAAGQIVFKSDGNFDRSCATAGGNWNAVYIQHADGSIAWYGHMKNGSPTTKPVGSGVTAGEYLGVVGSSGNSTGPHLHLEIYDSGGDLVDYWGGACNSMGGVSWWQSQNPYYDSAVNRVTTGGSPPAFPACPTQESPNSAVNFGNGPTIYFTTYYRDQLAGQVSTYTIYKPNGVIWSQWTHSISPAHYAASWWYWFTTLPTTDQGTWRFTVDYQSKLYERFFTVGDPAASGRVPQYAVQGTPLQVQKSGSQVRLTWGPSCNAGDNDYVVYEGAIGSFTGHLPVMCSTANLRDVTFTPGADGRYFLVGPRNATREGSLGVASDGTERSQGSSLCLTRLALQCP